MKIIPALFIAISLAFPVSARWMLPKVGQSQWDALLKQFVNMRHRVDYAGLKKYGAQRLNEYIVSLGRPGSLSLSPNEKKAQLINAYNAFTIQWVVENYPIKSIWSTDSPFTAARHRLGGKMVSLNEIESQLRAMGDPRIHAALVCAARSCPPLRREAYVASRLDDQLDENVREWLANPALNRFEPSKGKAIISPIFEWYRKDFDSYPGGLQGFLGKYAPPDVIKELGDKKLEVSYLTYDWGLNDQSGLGGKYSRLQFAIDWVLNWFRNIGS
jgi:Protein of unknown function, DUF547